MKIRRNSKRRRMANAIEEETRISTRENKMMNKKIRNTSGRWKNQKEISLATNKNVPGQYSGHSCINTKKFSTRVKTAENLVVEKVQDLNVLKVFVADQQRVINGSKRFVVI